MSVDSQLKELEAKFAEHGQQHLFAFTSELSAEQKQELLSSLNSVDLEHTKWMYETITKEPAEGKEEISQFEKVVDSQRSSAEELKGWYEQGLKDIAAGQSALLLLAGGQGTRLGYFKPKGTYDIGLPSHKSLFQLQAERLVKLKALAAELTGTDVKGISVPWYIMTSHFTHQDTLDFFEANKYFGLPKEDVIFFQQGVLPCLTQEGKLLLSSKSSLATAPNGNGGVYHGLVTSGALKDMDRRGIKHIHVYCVDNALVKVLDPTFLGFCASTGADCCNKVCRKEDPHERVGVMCRRNGAPSVIEYSEISKELAEARDPETGLLQYGAANIANHYLSIEFLHKVVSDLKQLPLHKAVKKIGYVNSSGEQVKPEEPNGLKVEMFVFDVFHLASNMWAFSTARQGEFSPLKNAQGKDSAETCRKDVYEYHKLLVEKAGGKVASEEFEIDPAVSYDGENLQSLVQGKTIETNRLS